MDTAPTPTQPPADTVAIAGQPEHWAATFDANPDMYGTDPSAPGLVAAEVFAAAGAGSVLELGAGQGRDTLYLARQGLRVTALDIATGAGETISAKARAAGLSGLVNVACHDVHDPLPLPDASFDASCGRGDWWSTRSARRTTPATAPARPGATTCMRTAGSSSTSSTARSSSASPPVSSSSTSATSPRGSCRVDSPGSPCG